MEARVEEGHGIESGQLRESIWLQGHVVNCLAEWGDFNLGLPYQTPPLDVTAGCIGHNMGKWEQICNWLRRGCTAGGGEGQSSGMAHI